jgi:hypothetical protein
VKYIQRGVNSTDLYAKKASHLALATVVEGCSLYIRAHYLESFLQYIYKGVTDPEPVVRNAALYALGQFSEHQQVSFCIHNKIMFFFLLCKRIVSFV